MTTDIDSGRVLVATDSGTHSGPRRIDVYRLRDGRYKTVTHFAGGFISSDITDRIPSPLPDTQGRFRWTK